MIETNVHYVSRKKNGQAYRHYDNIEDAIQESLEQEDVDRIEKRTTTFEREIVWKR